MPRVLVIGSINMDLVMRAERLPYAGETLLGGEFTVAPGGKGANQAAAAARLGCEVRLVGAVGDDDYGRAALANLARQGVDVSRVAQAEGILTGVAMIVVDRQGENTIVVAPGANQSVTPAVLEADRALFDWAEIVVMQCEIPLETVGAAVAMARKAEVPVILNAAPATSDLPGSLLQIDYLVVNEEEAATLTDYLPGDDIRQAYAAAGMLRRQGAKVAIVTLGDLGCVYESGYYDSERIQAPLIEAVDTTGAGDAFIGGLATAICRGWEIERALYYANCAGALAATKLGAQSSLPTAEEVDRLFQEFHGSG